MKRPNTQPRVKRSALKIAGVYAFFGFLWILLSDKVLAALVDDPQQITTIEIYKGWFYILVTACLVYILVRGMEDRMNTYLDRLAHKNEDLRTLIGQRREVEHEREVLLGELAEKAQELENILYAGSHDLRTPLQTIQQGGRMLEGGCEELRRVLEAEQLPEESKEKLTALLEHEIAESNALVVANSARMAELLQGVLRLSWLGRVLLQVEELDMDKLVRGVVDSMREQIEESGAVVKVEKLPRCGGDDEQLGQVFRILLDNALKYLDSARAGEIVISGKAEHGQTVYCVTDNGVGISGSQKEKVFDLFFRMRPDGPIQGRGVGLTIVRRIMGRHGGRVWVESVAGEGSKFFVSVPQKRRQA